MFPELELQSILEPAAADTIRQVVSDVLETMFFSEAETTPCDHAWLATAPGACVRFEGSHSGDMLLGISLEAADAIAGGFLGLDSPELTDTLRGQVLQELANILCGALLSHLWPASQLALASPEITAWQEWPVQELASETVLHRCFLLPEGMLALSIRLISAARAEPAA